ncbi:hypothetical protein FKP32DRAFT_1761929 [Trametes sanguinea]|nr:hypothetical protein FKP32DRAFT_1761929 [Trametes sanguinea]
MTSHDHANTRLSPEIVESICRILLHRSYQSRATKAYKTVVNLSITCKHFRDPALNVIWHTIPDVASLFLLLPNTLYARKKRRLRHATRSDSTATYLFFHDDVREDQLSTFFAYARRVKAMDQQNLYNVTVPDTSAYAAPSVYDVLAKLLRGRPLFPNLKSLRYVRHDSAPLSIFRSFHILFGQQLQEVEIYSHSMPEKNRLLEHDAVDDEHAANLLNMLKEKAPYLRKVRLTLTPSQDLTKAAVGPFVYALTNENLVSVQMVRDLPLPPQAFRHFGTLPRLRTLNIDVNHPAWSTYSAPDLQDDARPLFPSLRKLQINGPTLAPATKLLPLISSPVLKELCVDASQSNRVPRHELHPLFAAIAALPSGRTTLATLYVRIGSVARGDQVVADADPAARVRWACADKIPDPIGEKTLEPLMSMPQLEDIMLHIGCPFDLDDELLRKLAGAWRDIDRLILGRAYPIPEYQESEDEDDGAMSSAPEATPDQTDEERPRPLRPCAWRRPRASILTLHAFAVLCPRLTVLGLEVVADLTKYPRCDRERRPHPQMPQHPLDTLFVGLSPIDADPLSVAAFLSDWFPWLAEVNSSWEEVDEGDPEAEAGDEDGILEFDDWSEAHASRVRWNRVQDLVPKLVEVRRQERQWRAKAAGLGPLPKSRWADEGPLDLDDLMDLSGSDDSDLAY